MGVASVILVIVKEEWGCFYEGEEGGRWREVTCVVWGKLRVLNGGSYV